MALATHLGPLLLGTVKNGTGQNMGAAVVSQSVSCSGSTLATSLVVPAGSQILECNFLTTTTAVGATLNISIGSTSIVTGLDVSGGTITAAFALPYIGTSAAVAKCANVGTTDATVTATRSTSSVAGTFIVTYVVRNSDGSYLPTASTN